MKCVNIIFNQIIYNEFLVNCAELTNYDVYALDMFDKNRTGNNRPQNVCFKCVITNPQLQIGSCFHCPSVLTEDLHYVDKRYQPLPYIVKETIKQMSDLEQNATNTVSNNSNDIDDDIDDDGDDDDDDGDNDAIENIVSTATGL
eukprot:Pgem_evm1s5130